MEDVAHEKPAEITDEPFVGSSAAITAARELMARIGPTDLSVLIVGASGTGKEAAAHVVHQLSARASGPFITVRCSTPHEEGLEAQLFGLEMSDAFASGQETASLGGQIAAAKGGTLFLSDIGD